MYVILYLQRARTLPDVIFSLLKYTQHRAAVSVSRAEAAALFYHNPICASKKFEVKTADVQLTVDPERSYLIETRVIDGRPYLLIPAEGVEINGLAVNVGTVDEAAEDKESSLHRHDSSKFRVRNLLQIFVDVI